MGPWVFLVYLLVLSGRTFVQQNVSSMEIDQIGGISA
jgi:hypothetical protein